MKKKNPTTFFKDKCSLVKKIILFGRWTERNHAEKNKLCS